MKWKIGIPAAIIIAALILIVMPEPFSAEEIFREFAKTGEIPDVELPENSNIVLGKIEVFPDNQHEHEHTYPFRMGLMIVTEDGRRITDFFKGIPAPVGDIWYKESGDAILPVPKVFGLLGPTNEALSAFTRDFPELSDINFQLTFKEFHGGTYYLENVPKGRAYLWFQTHDCEGRVTQIPTLFDFDPEQGVINRVDIITRDSRFLFVNM